MLRDIHLHGALADLRSLPLTVHVDSATDAWRTCESLIPGFRAATLTHAHHVLIEIEGDGRREVVTVATLALRLPDQVRGIHITPEASGEYGIGAIAAFVIAVVALAVSAYTILTMETPEFGKGPGSKFFDGPVTAVREGEALPLAYGRVLLGPLVVSAGIEAERRGGTTYTAQQREPRDSLISSRSTARIVDVLCAGPIKGLVDGNNSIRIAGTPLPDTPEVPAWPPETDYDGWYGFMPLPQTGRDGGVSVDFSRGAENEMRDFGLPSVEIGVATNEPDAITRAQPLIRRVSSVTATRARVTVRLNALRRYQNNGKLRSWQFGIRIDVRATSVGWAEADAVVQEVVAGEATAPFELSWGFSLNGIERPYIRVSRTTPDDDSDRKKSAFSWTSWTQITEDQISYYRSAAAVLTIEAETMRDISSRAYEIYASETQMPSTYDPASGVWSEAYGDELTWDGSFHDVLVWHDNPAWVLYDLLSLLLGPDDPALTGAKMDFYRIGLFCAELVDDGLGGMEPRYAFNGVFSKREKALTALRRVTASFDIDLYYSQGVLYPIIGERRDPVALVTAANAKDASFVYTGGADHERYSAVAVEYNDPEHDYRRTTELVVVDALVERYGHRVRGLVAHGYTSRGQACRLGRHYLHKQEHENDQIAYTAGADHASVRPGDIVRVADPVVAGGRLFGRVTRVDVGNARIFLDGDIAGAQADGWMARWITPAGAMVSRAVETLVRGDIASLTFAEDIQDDIVIGAVVILDHAEVAARQWRITKVDEVSHVERKIHGQAYDPGRYTAVEQGIILSQQNYTLTPVGRLAPPAEVTITPRVIAVDDAIPRRLLDLAATPAADARAGAWDFDVRGPEDDSWLPAARGAGQQATYDGGEVYGSYAARARARAGIFRSAWLEAAVPAIVVSPGDLQPRFDPYPPLVINHEVIVYRFVLAEPHALAAEMRCRRTTEGRWTWTRMLFGGELVFRHAGLPPETEYQCQVRVLYLHYGWSVWSERGTATTADAPFLAPGNAAATPASASTIEYTWETVPGCDGYLVQGWRTDMPGLAFSVTAAAQTDTSLTVTELEPGTLYRAHISALVPDWALDTDPVDGDLVDSSEYGAWTSDLDATTFLAPSDNPIDGDTLGLAVTADGQEALTYTWMVPEGALEYHLRCREVGQTTAQAVITSVSPPANSHAYDSLTAETAYECSIRVRNAAGWGAYSDWLEGTTLAAPALPLLAAPANVRLTSSTSSTLNIAWDAVTDAAGYYVIEGAQRWFTTATTFTASGLLPGTMHTYKVVAVRDNDQYIMDMIEQGVLSASRTWTTPAISNPLANVVADFAATPTSFEMADFSWTVHPAWASGSYYQIRTRESAHSTYFYNTTSPNTNESSLGITNLTAETSYTSSIRLVVPSVGQTPWSSGVVFSTLAGAGDLTAPANFRVSATTDDWIVLAWNNVPGAAAYIAQFWEHNESNIGGPYTLISTNTTGVLVISSLPSWMRGNADIRGHVAAVIPGYLDDDTQMDGDYVDGDEISPWSAIISLSIA